MWVLWEVLHRSTSCISDLCVCECEFLTGVCVYINFWSQHSVVLLLTDWLNPSSETSVSLVCGSSGFLHVCLSVSVCAAPQSPSPAYRAPERGNQQVDGSQSTGVDLFSPFPSFHWAFHSSCLFVCLLSLEAASESNSLFPPAQSCRKTSLEQANVDN